MNVDIRLSAVFLFLSIIILFTGQVSFIQLNKISEPLIEDIPNSFNMLHEASDKDVLAKFILYYDEVLTQSARNYAFTKDKKWEERYKEAEPKLDAIIKEAILKSDEKEKAIFSSIDESNLALVEMEYSAIELVNSNQPEEAIEILGSEEYWGQKEIYEAGLKEYFQIAGYEYDTAVKTSRDKINSATNQTKILVRKSKLLLFYLFLCSVFLAIGIGIFTVKTVSKPLTKLSKTAVQLREEGLVNDTETKSRDELELLSRTVMNMANDLKSYQEKIGRLEKEKSKNGNSKEMEDYVAYLEKARVATLDMMNSLKESNEHLKEAGQSKAEFLNMVSHELKTPLTPIRANLDLLIDGDLGELNEKQMTSLKTLLRNTDRLNSLIHNLLEISRIEAGKMVLNIQKLKLNDIVKEIVEDATLAAKEKNIEIVQELGKIPIVEVDKDRIRECISNYVYNAIKFTHEGSITITTSKQDNFVKVSVKDTGVGIEKSNIPKLFGKFYQEGKTEVGKAQGVGLGLYSIKRIMELHNGEVGVDTEIGKGSTFWLKIPVKGDKNEKNNLRRG